MDKKKLSLMLSSAAARLSLRPLSRTALPALSRGFCAPAVPLVDQVRAELADMKEKIGVKAEAAYTPESFSAALASGTMDATKLSSTLDFSDDARKVRFLHSGVYQGLRAMPENAASQGGAPPLLKSAVGRAVSHRLAAGTSSSAIAAPPAS